MRLSRYEVKRTGKNIGLLSYLPPDARSFLEWLPVTPIIYDTSVDPRRLEHWFTELGEINFLKVFPEVSMLLTPSDVLIRRLKSFSEVKTDSIHYQDEYQLLILV